MTVRADLFCRVVDNYGDIGVCWRLARQLAREHGWQMRLWVDDLISFARLEKTVDSRQLSQRVDGVQIIHWTQPAPDLDPLDVVIEAFACDPPPAYRHQMQDHIQRPVWINLEYLSAQEWVEHCHGLPSPQAGGLLKYFFFPGFTPRSGGLLREAELPAERDAFQQDPQAQASFLARLGLPPRPPGGRLVTLFCYPDAPASLLARTLAADETETLLVIPEGVAPYLQPGRQGNLTIARLPFIPQADYDRLLWCADLNFVRGEDSFVRAQWAGRPMVWHIYPQDEAAHVDKLSAWLARYPTPSFAHDISLGWNGEIGGNLLQTQLAQALLPASQQAWAAGARLWCEQLEAQPDLAARLAGFCAEVRQKRE
jgi:uncharacterized repeat protein (TIGR03837 family)